VVVLQRIPPETVLDEYVNVVMDELRNRGEGGGLLASFPLMKLRVTLEGIETLEGQTTDVALRIAAGDAFEKALAAGGKVLLEPIMRLDILTPDDYLGDFVGDLQQRRAIIAKTESRGGGRTFIEANAPLASLFGYSSAMRSLSQGRAGCSMEPLEYAPAPPEVVRKYEMV
jgi:elongation factor G